MGDHGGQWDTTGDHGRLRETTGHGLGTWISTHSEHGWAVHGGPRVTTADYGRPLATGLGFRFLLIRRLRITGHPSTQTLFREGCTSILIRAIQAHMQPTTPARPNTEVANPNIIKHASIHTPRHANTEDTTPTHTPEQQSTMPKGPRYRSHHSLESPCSQRSK